MYVQLPDVGETVTEGGKKPIYLETVCYLTEQETEEQGHLQW